MKARRRNISDSDGGHILAACHVEEIYPKRGAIAQHLLADHILILWSLQSPNT